MCLQVMSRWTLYTAKQNLNSLNIVRIFILQIYTLDKILLGSWVQLELDLTCVFSFFFGLNSTVVPTHYYLLYIYFMPSILLQHLNGFVFVHWYFLHLPQSPRKIWHGSQEKLFGCDNFEPWWSAASLYLHTTLCFLLFTAFYISLKEPSTYLFYRSFSHGFLAHLCFLPLSMKISSSGFYNSSGGDVAPMFCGRLYLACLSLVLPVWSFELLWG